MAVRSGFFNSINGDRVYSATHWAEYFATFIGNGVFPNPSSNLQIASNNNMTISVKAGKGWINGYILINDSDYLLDITPADGVLNRIDRIVMRYDTVDREIRLEVKQGTFATNPTAPVLQRDADAFELALADIRVNAGAISISQANITDTRLNDELCGIVHGVVDQVDTTTLFNQYQSWIEQEKLRFENDVDDWLANEQLDFETWEQQQKDDFDMWFANIQDILDGNVAANLQNQITQLQTDLGNIDAPSTQEFESLQSDFSAHQAESTQQAHLAKNIGLEDTTGNFTATELEGAMSELFTNVSNGKSLVGGAIAGVDDSVVIPIDPTFQNLADGVGQISTGKKWASGIGGSTGSPPTLTVRGLNFRPRLVITLSVQYMNFVFIDDNGVRRDYYHIDTLNHQSSGLRPSGFVPSMFNDGFRINTNNSGSFNWMAYE